MWPEYVTIINAEHIETQLFREGAKLVEVLIIKHPIEVFVHRCPVDEDVQARHPVVLPVEDGTAEILYFHLFWARIINFRVPTVVAMVVPQVILNRWYNILIPRRPGRQLPQIFELIVIVVPDLPQFQLNALPRDWFTLLLPKTFIRYVQGPLIILFKLRVDFLLNRRFERYTPRTHRMPRDL